MTETNTVYPDLLESIFPLEIDNFDRYAALNLDSLLLMKQYYAYLEKDNIVAANDLLEKNPVLNRYAITEKSMNQLRDAIIAIERFYFSDVQNYLVNIVKYRKAYDGSVKYQKYDVVTYANKGAYETYMCCTTDCPIGTLPTELAYWTPITLRGEKGESGTGLSPRGRWDNITIYYKDDLVSFNNKLWAAVRDNTGVQPILSSSDTWIVIMEFDTNMFSVIDDSKDMRYRLGTKEGYFYYQNEASNEESDKMFLAKKSDLDNKIKTIKDIKLDLASWDSTTCQYKYINSSVLNTQIPTAYFDEGSRKAAMKADIYPVAYNGFIIFKAKKLPKTDLVIDILTLIQS